MGIATERSRRPGRPQTRAPENSGSRTLLVGIEMLKTVARLPAPATLSEIGRAADMSPSRAYRYLVSLVQSGLVQYDPRTGNYSLGPAALDLGAAALSKVDAIQIASEIIRDLTGAVHLVSHITVWGSNGPTVVRWEQGNLPVAIRIREGFNVSLPITSSGRIFLAYADEQRVAPFLRRDVDEWNATVPSSKRFTPSKIRSITKTVRTHGLACVVGLLNPHLATISAPVFDRDGLAMSLTLSGIEGSFDTSLEGEPARYLKTAADQVSHRLGGRTSEQQTMFGGSTVPKILRPVQSERKDSL